MPRGDLPLLYCSNEYTTSAAVTSSPLWNLTPWRSLNSQVRSSSSRQDSASRGTCVKRCPSKVTRGSKTWRWTVVVPAPMPPPADAGSIDATSSATATTHSPTLAGGAAAAPAWAADPAAGPELPPAGVGDDADVQAASTGPLAPSPARVATVHCK